MSRKTKLSKLRPQQGHFDASQSAAALIVYRALEPRTVFDAAVMATGVEVAKEQAHVQQASHDLAVSADPAHSQQGQAEHALAAALRDAPSTQATVTSVVFVDSAVSDVAVLLKDIPATSTVVMLEANKDGVQQIAQYLANHAGVGAVHILSHGSEANLYLGTADLNTASIASTYAADLAAIKSSLAANADILIYGCDFAKGSDGDAAAHALAKATGANVAASTDRTGTAAGGGNWVLEDTIGTISAHTIVAPDWGGELAVTITSGGSAASLVAAATNGSVGVTIVAGSELVNGKATGGIFAGTFTTANSNLGLASGLVISTGDLAALTGGKGAAYTGGGNGFFASTAGSAVSGTGGQFDVATVSFSFTANTNKIALSAIFGSEEYYQYVNSGYADNYQVLLTGGTYVNSNIAVVPNTVAPISINTINKTVNPTFNRDNTVAAAPVADLALNGITTVLNNVFTVAKGTTYTIKFQVADIGDNQYDSAAFINFFGAALTLDLDAANKSAPGTAYAGNFVGKGGVAIVNTDAQITNFDPATKVQTATVVLTNATAGDVLNVGALPAGITYTTDISVAGKVTLKLTGGLTNTTADFQTALKAITFNNSNSLPALSFADRTISISVNDGTTDSNTATSTIHIIQDVAPVETVPGAQTTNANATLAINGLSVADADAGTSTETVTLSVANGTLTLAGKTGLTFGSGTGTGDTTVTFTGTLANINAAIAGLSYKPALNYVGADTLTFTTNDNGNTGVTPAAGYLSTTQTVAITVKDVPPVAVGKLANLTYADGTSSIAVATAGGFTDAAGLPLTYSVSGLPAGLLFNTSTGQITGAIDHLASKNGVTVTGSNGIIDGKYTVTVTAKDSAGAFITQTFTIDATNQAPVVGTVTANLTAKAGDAISGTAVVNTAAAFSDPNAGDTLSYAATSLPAGLAISSAGVISGTIAATAPGTYTVKVTATDDKGASASETFTWVVADVPPAVVALPNQTVTDAQAGVSIATAGGFTNPLALPASQFTYSATGLPAGLSINAATGVISGTVDHLASKNAPVTSGTGAMLDGTYTVKVTVSDGQGGSATQTFKIDSTNQAPVLGTKTLDQASNAGATVTAVNASSAFSDPNVGPGTGDTLTYAASGLPTGLSINSAGVITGTIANATKPGSYAVIVTATDDKGASTIETFNWVVKDVPPVASGTLANKIYADSTGGVSISTASGFTDPLGLPLTYSVTGLPAGLTFNPATGAITGTLDHDASKNGSPVTGSNGLIDGKYMVTVTASDGQGGSAVQIFTIDATNQAPTIVSGAGTASQTSNAGAAVTLDSTPAFTDPNTGDVLTYSVSGLPAGLAINTVTGKITGTIAASAAKTPGYSVKVTATDDKGAAVTETFTWTVNNVPPTPAGTLPAQVLNDAQAGIAIATAGGFVSPLGLPLSYTVTGLPAGLSINPATGKIAGTLDHNASLNAPSTTGAGATLDGKYTVTVTVSDGQGGTASQTFTLDARNQAPTLGTATINQTTTDGAIIAPLNISGAFSDPNTDPLTFSAIGLPPGLAIDASGNITGKVAANNTSASAYSVTVIATDNKGAATTETFTWTINPANTISNVVLPDASTGVSIATAGGFNGTLVPKSYSITGLPAGLAFDTATGIISGTLDHDASKNAPTVTGAGASLDGKYTVTVTATDGTNSATRTFTIDATNQVPTVTTTTAAQSNTAGAAVTAVDVTGAFADPNTAPGTADTLTYSATGLPSGLSITSAGIISGTIANTAKPGAYAVAVTARDDKGATVTETFTWTVTDVPPTSVAITPQSVNDSASVSINVAGSFSDPLGLPLSYTASGLPKGLSIDASGTITGTIDHDASKAAPGGVYSVTVTASDGQGGTTSQTFTITSANQAPVVGTNTGPLTAAAGAAVAIDSALAFSDPNAGDTLGYTASGLPPGLSINAVTGKITGVIAATAPKSGPYSVAITATDDKGAAVTETFIWTVTDVPPVAVGSIADQLVKDSQTFSLPVSAKFSDPLGLPLTYSAANLPKGLSIDPATGIISGTIDHDASKAAAGGTYAVSVTADDGQGGTIKITFNITSTNQAPAISAQTPTQSASDGAKVALNAAAAFTDPNPGDILTYTASGLPTGLGIDPNTGLISGTIDPTASKTGPYTVSVTATDDKGLATTETFTFIVANVPPTSTAVANQAVNDAQSVSIPVTGSFTDPLGLPLSYTATGLPKGLSIDANGTITGTVDHDASKSGPYTVTVTASDGQGGTTSQTFTITSANQAPVVSALTPTQSSTDGATVALNVASAFTDPNTGDTLTYAAKGLPKGLTIDPVTGVISGTIDKSASLSGPYSVTITATDDKGLATSETFTWSVADVPPVVASQIANQTVKDSQAFILATAANFTEPVAGLTLSYSATGLPKGLTIDPASGKIVGTIDHDASIAVPNGVYTVTVTVTASDGQGGTVSQAFTITSSNDAPLVSAPTPGQIANNGDKITLNASAAFTDANAGDVLKFTAAGLPKGLTIDPVTGVISGTIDKSASTGGPFSVAVTATDDKGASVTEYFTWAVNNVPPGIIGPIADQIVNDGQAYTLDTSAGFYDPLGLPLTYTASGLPAGLTIDKSTGVISGNVNHDASTGASGGPAYSVTIIASDGQGGSSAQTFQITSLNQAPNVTALTPSQNSKDGDAVALNVVGAFTDPNAGDTLTFKAAGLPTGLSITSAGVITGKIAPSASLSGPFSVTVTATDDKGLATTETFTWTVNDQPPVAVGSIAAVAVKDSQSLSLATAGAFNDPLGLPLTYTATGLPKGLSIDANGVITGTIDHNASQAAPGGVYTVSVTASDGQSGTVTQSFMITSANDAPVINTAAKTPNQISTDNGSVTLDVSGAFADPNTSATDPLNHDTLTFTASGLPKGLTIDPATGIISGTVDKSASVTGSYPVTVTASDGKGGTVTETFTWSVNNDPPVVASALAPITAHDSAAVSIPVASGFSDPLGLPLTYGAKGLPVGFSIDPKTGLITGTLGHDASKNVGTYAITVTASDGQGGQVAQAFTLTAVNDAPVVSANTPSQLSTDGSSVIVSAAGAFTDPNTGDTLTFAASGLPKGLVIDAATGVISGTIDKSASVAANGGPTYAISVTATDDKGLAVTETFNWTIDNLPPQATPALPAQAVYDAQTFSLDTSKGFQNPLGLALGYTATGLPAGLAIDKATGRITGTIDHNASQTQPGGIYTVAVTVDDGQGGTATSTFTITAGNQAPVVAALTPNQTSVDGAAVSLNVSGAFTDPNTIAGNPANSDTLTFSAVGLPKGLVIDANTGVISGTIDKSASVAGTYSVTVTSSDGKGGLTPETFSWTVSNVPPTATAIAPATVNDGQPVSLAAGTHFTDPIGVPLAFSATGLPKGLTIDPKSGVISGTIDHDASANAPGGVYSVTVMASDGQGGTVAETFAITSTNQAPALTTALTGNQTGSNGGAASLSVVGAFSDPNPGDTVTYSAAGLPAGLSIDAKTGLITGTIDPLASTLGSNGVYSVTVTATDDKGLSTPETFTWTVDSKPLSASPIPNVAAYDAQKVAIPVGTSFAPSDPKLTLTFTSTPLPAGLTLDPKNGVISGTLLHDASQTIAGGLYSVTITADDGQQTISKSFTITAANEAPQVTTLTPSQASVNGSSVSLDITSSFSDPNTDLSNPLNSDTLTYSATGLPKGLSISAAGLITGTIDKSASQSGPYSVVVWAADGKGGATSETFTWTVADVPPVATAVIPNAVVNDSQSVAINAGATITDPLGLPLSFSAAGLPKGLVIDPKTGAITGTIDHAASSGGNGGVYTITVTASDGQGGTVDQTFTLQSVNQAPAIIAQTPTQSSQNAAAVSLDASAAFKDPNAGDTVSFAAKGLPKGLAIDPVSGLISGTIDPHASLTGLYTVSITATDDKGASTTETFTWTVTNVAPVATLALPSQTVQDGNPVTVPTALGFKDPIGVALTYSATGLPKGLSIDPNTGVIAGTIDHDASKSVAGGVFSVVVTVNDGQGGQAANAFTLVSTNQPPVVSTPTPPQVTNAGAAVTLDTAGAFSDPNTASTDPLNHDTLTFKATGLPPGLAIDPATGQITGSIDVHAPKVGSFTASVTATDDKGASVTETFTWTVKDVPPQPAGSVPALTVPDGAAIATIDTSANFTSPLGLPLTYAAASLPKGLTLNPMTGKITGTIDHDASAPANGGPVYSVTITADDGQGGTATQTFVITATNQAPVIGTATANQSANAGSAIAAVNAASAFSDPNAGDTLTYTASGLPKGVSIDKATGQITGFIDPAAAQAAAYSVQVTATDDKGLATTETFTWTINDVPPTATGTVAPASFPDSTANITVDASTAFASPLKLPLTFSATGLPSWLSIDPKSGKITGTLPHDASRAAPATTGAGATLTGSYTITVTADDGHGGTATKVVTINATNQAPALVTANATPNQTGNAGSAVATFDAGAAFSDPNTGDMLTFAASGLPKGLVIDPKTGAITGTIDPAAAKAKAYSVTVTATDDKGATTAETFTWTVNDVPPTSTGTVAPASFPDGTAQISVDTSTAFASPIGLPLTYSATGLPAWLSIDSKTGAISGSLPHDASSTAPAQSGAGASLVGTYTITVTVDDGHGGTAMKTITIDTTNQAPAIGTATANQTSKSGASVSLVAALAFSDPNTGDTLTYAATGLPKGLSIGATGTITGTIDPTAGQTPVYSVTVTATDNKGASTTEAFTWVVDDVPPTVTKAITAAAFPDGTAKITIDAAAGFASPIGLPLSYSATGLPKGLVIDPKTGAITGSIDHDASAGGNGGVYTVRVTADDGHGGTATQTFAIASTNQAPVIGTATPGQTTDAGTNVSVEVGLAFGDPNAGDVLSFKAAGLPKGLAIDPVTGKITGTIAATAPGSYTVTVTATDDKGAATSQTFTWTVKDVPPASQGLVPARSFQDGSTMAIASAPAFVSPLGLPLAYSASGLPAGLAIDPTTGLITGTLPNDASLKGPYTVTVMVSDGYGGFASQTLLIAGLDVAPLTQPDTATVLQGKSVTLAPLLKDSSIEGNPLTVTSAIATHGLVTNNADGTLSYTPSPNFFGSETITLFVADGHGGVSRQIVTVTVIEQPAPPTAAAPVAPSPASRPASTPFLNVNGAVIDAMREIGASASVSGQIGAKGAVLSAVEGVQSLNGTAGALTGPGSVIRQALGVNHAPDPDGLGLHGRSLSAFDLEGLTGFSLHFTLDGVLASSNGGGQLIIETLVRERQLLVQLSNTYAEIGRHVVEYRVLQADGRPLPGWLDSAKGGLLIGEAPASVEEVQIRVEAILDDRTTQTRLITIQTRTGEIQPLVRENHTELPRLFREKLGTHTTLAAHEIAELAHWLAA